MKNQIVTVIAIISSFFAHAQSTTFNNVLIENRHGRDIMSFTVLHDQNVRHYRIEAGNDSSNLSVVATMPSIGNGIFATDYKFDVTAFHYMYYRIGKVEMSGQMPYSAIVNTREHEDLVPTPMNKGGQLGIGNDVVVKH